ncbi:MAG: hypothetical protein U0641_01385 [Anaerolineae bacterium]
MEATSSNVTTLDDVFVLARRLSVSDQVRLIGRLAPLLAEAVEGVEDAHRRPLRGLLADLGAAPSAQDIDDVRREMWASLPFEDGE